MRITIILGPFIPVPPVLGGSVEKVHLLLAKAYRAAGHEVVIISRKYKDFAEDETVDGIRYIRIASFDRASSLAVNLFFDFCYALRVSFNLPQADVTITNSFFTPLLLPHKKSGKIYVQVGRFPKGQMLLYKRADRIQAVSRTVAEAITREAPKLTHKIVTIGYAIPDAYFHWNKERGREKTILFVGRVAREKGLHLLLKAFEFLVKNGDPVDINEWKLRIIGPYDVKQGGDGADYQAELMQLADSMGSACELVGPVFEERALIQEYQSASVFVYPSLAETGEALPVAPLEALAAGCAVVVSDLHCFDDYIEHGVSGLRFDHRSPHAEQNLALALAGLIAAPTLIRDIADKGNMVARNFHTSVIAGKMLADFKTLIVE